MADYRVFKSTRGEFFIDPVDDNNPFVVSFDGKDWKEGLIFDPYAAQELLLVSDPAEAETILNSAKKHFQHDSVVV